MYQATTAEYLFFPPAELRKETLPGLLLGSYNQQEILEQGHSQTCWGEIKANVHGNIKAGGEEKKNQCVLLAPGLKQTLYQPSFMKSGQSILTHLGKAVEME